jgi:hypothetical protein
VTSQIECSELHVANGEFFGRRMKSWLEDSDAVVFEDVKERGLAGVIETKEQQFCMRNENVSSERSRVVSANLLACLFISPRDERTSQTLPVSFSQYAVVASRWDEGRLTPVTRVSLARYRLARAVRRTSQESTYCRLV